MPATSCEYKQSEGAFEFFTKLQLEHNELETLKDGLYFQNMSTSMILL